MTKVVLQGDRLEGLELILSGLLGPVDGFCLPGRKPDAWADESNLAASSDVTAKLDVGDIVTLCDPDNTPLASVVVEAIDGEWIAGPVTGLRAPEHGVSRARRLTSTTDFSARVVALFGGEFSASDVLRAERVANGKPLALVAVGGPDAGASARLVRELDACSTILIDSTVWFLPQAIVAAAPAADIAQWVIAGRGPADLVDYRRSGEPDVAGAVVLFTGLSGAGKSTIARAVTEQLSASGAHKTILLDGDHVRTELASELTFSAEDRDTNLRRIAWVAARIAEVGGLAVCAPIAPFELSRKAMRAQVEPYAPFIVVYVSTPIEVAEERDRKGLYAKARAGLISDFTGIDSPYEVPEDADLVIDTSRLNVGQCVDAVVDLLRRNAIVT